MAEIAVQSHLKQQHFLYSPEAQAFLQQIEAGGIDRDRVSSWRSPAVERREGSDIEGRGLFVVDDIPANTLVAIKQGHVLTSRQVKDNAHIIQGSHQQIDRDRFLAGLTPEEVEKNLIGYNHSCSPKARVVLQRGVSLAFLVTNEAVSPDDESKGEITVDYSLTQASDTHRINICNCGAPNCRRFIAPLWDWEQESFQKEHAGQMAWFIEEMIEDYNKGDKEVLDVHSVFAPAKTAAMVRLTDDAVKDALRSKERFFAEYVPGRFFQRILRGTFERRYEETQEYKDLQELEAYRLRFAMYFCAFGLSAEQGRELSVDISFVDILQSSGFMGDERAQQQVREHLPELVEVARLRDYEMNP